MPHTVYTSDYLLSTESVLHAARRLRKDIDADRATQEYAITRLERAAQQHETGGTAYRDFMFSELETTAETDKATRERVAEDTMASVLTDLQAANVVIAAGLTLGETGEKAEPRLLDDALLSLDNTRRAIERSLASPLAEVAEPGRFGFEEEVTAPEVVQSDNLSSAIDTFRELSVKTLNELVSEAEGVATSVITALDKLDQAKVLAALSKLGDQLQELPRIGRLLRQGIAMVERAIDALIRLLGSEALAQVKKKVEGIWKEVKEGKYVDQALKWAFGIEATETQIEGILGSKGLKQKALDDASNALGPLAITFKENMAMAKGLATGVAVVGTALALTPLAGPNVVLLTAVAYLTILGAVVLIGMDYAGSDRILQRVRGVREIAQGVVS